MHFLTVPVRDAVEPYRRVWEQLEAQGHHMSLYAHAMTHLVFMTGAEPEYLYSACPQDIVVSCLMFFQEDQEAAGVDVGPDIERALLQVLPPFWQLLSRMRPSITDDLMGGPVQAVSMQGWLNDTLVLGVQRMVPHASYPVHLAV